MKKATTRAIQIGLAAIALSCWAFPLETTAQTLKSNSQTKPLIVAVHHYNYTSPDLIIKDNAIVASSNGVAYNPVKSLPAGKSSNGNLRPSFSGRNYSKEEVQQLIREYSQRYGISADLPLGIARCESGFNQLAKNRISTASGVYQWLRSSWLNQPASAKGSASVFDAEANVSAAVWLIAHGKTSPWNASRSCWSK